jgi:flagellar motor switch protein FliG
MEEDFLGPLQKVAILMVALGEDTTAEIMKYLGDAEIESISQAISETDVVTTEQEDEVLEEFEQLLVAGKYVSQGGLDFARGALEKALGPRKSQEVLDRVTSTTRSGFYVLRNVEPSQIIPFISKEHPQTIALILTQLDPQQAAGILSGLSLEMQSEVAYRVAKIGNISPQTLRDLEESLTLDLEAIISGQVAEIGGPKAVAEILNQSGHSTEKAIIESIDAIDPELAEEVRKQMFVFEDLVNLTDRDIQLILREVDQNVLSLALRGATDELKDRIFGNLSQRVATMLKEEMEFQGPARMSEIEEKQIEVIQTVKKLEEGGLLTIVRGDSNDVFI